MKSRNKKKVGQDVVLDGRFYYFHLLDLNVYVYVGMSMLRKRYITKFNSNAS